MRFPFADAQASSLLPVTQPLKRAVGRKPLAQVPLNEGLCVLLIKLVALIPPPHPLLLSLFVTLTRGCTLKPTGCLL